MSRSTDLNKVSSAEEAGYNRVAGAWIIAICIFVAIVVTQIKRTSPPKEVPPAQTAKP